MIMLLMACDIHTDHAIISFRRCLKRFHFNKCGLCEFLCSCARIQHDYSELVLAVKFVPFFYYFQFFS